MTHSTADIDSIPEHPFFLILCPFWFMQFLTYGTRDQFLCRIIRYSNPSLSKRSELGSCQFRSSARSNFSTGRWTSLGDFICPFLLISLCSQPLKGAHLCFRQPFPMGTSTLTFSVFTITSEMPIHMRPHLFVIMGHADPTCSTSFW